MHEFTAADLDGNLFECLTKDWSATVSVAFSRFALIASETLALQSDAEPRMVPS
jgi:hypothetical protein